VILPSFLDEEVLQMLSGNDVRHISSNDARIDGEERSLNRYVVGGARRKEHAGATGLMNRKPPRV
jgi:hypothetical protein